MLLTIYYTIAGRQLSKSLQVKPLLIQTNNICGCMRTTDAYKDIDELINYYNVNGINRIYLYDDHIEQEHLYNLTLKYDGIRYEYIGNRTNKKESDVLKTCFTKMYDECQYFTILDGDEFIYSPHINKKLSAIVPMIDSHCVNMPINWFGTSGNKKPQKYTIREYVYRDQPVGGAKYDKFVKSKNVTIHSDYYEYARRNNIGIRTFKVFYNKEYITKDIYKLILKKASRGILHGYKINCKFVNPPLLSIAHYTRSEEELKFRMNNFWTTYKGLNNRFNSKRSQDHYVSVRNKNEQLDMRVFLLYEHILMNQYFSDMLR